MARKTRKLVPAFALAACLLGANPAGAGWVIISNNTPAVLIVQELREDAGPLRRPRTVRLLPGEVYREFHPGEGKTTLQVYDARRPLRPMHKTPTTVEWGADEVALNLEADGTSVKLVKSEPPKPASLLPPPAVVPVSMKGAPPAPPIPVVPAPEPLVAPAK